jgi:hypothetical protein
MFLVTILIYKSCIGENFNILYANFNILSLNFNKLSGNFNLRFNHLFVILSCQNY